MSRGWLRLIAIAAIASGCATETPEVSEPATGAASTSAVSTTSPTDPGAVPTLPITAPTASTGTVDPVSADRTLAGRLVTEQDLPWTSGYGMFPNRAGDGEYNDPPSVADLCPSVETTPLIADANVHYEIDAHDDWVFIDEWVSSDAAAAATFATAVHELDRCLAEQRGVDAAVSIESAEISTAPGVDEARRYTIRLDAAGEDPVEHELLLARSGAVAGLMTIERSDILEPAEHRELLEAALTKLSRGAGSATAASSGSESAGERNDADVMATLDGYGPGNGGLMFTRTKSAIEADVPTLSSVDTISTYSIVDGGGVGLMITATPATGVDTSEAARDLAAWVAQHAFVAGGALRNDDGVMRPEITLIVGDQSYDSSYEQMVDLADGRLSPDAWLEATTQ